MKILFSVFTALFLVNCGSGNVSKFDGNNFYGNDNSENNDNSFLDDDSETTDSEIDDGWKNVINKGLEESFIDSSKGFVLKIVAPVLPETPIDRDLKPEEKPAIIEGELIDKKGEKFMFSDNNSGYAALYEEYLSIVAESKMIDNTYYSVSILPALATLDWMAENETDTINATYFYLYVYKNDLVSDKLFRSCPDAISDNKGDSRMKLYIDNSEWNFDNKFGMMVNSHITFDRKTVTSFFGDELHKLCYCYDIGNNGKYTYRDCTAKDMDYYPEIATNPNPADGAENISPDTKLSWNPGSDPDGGNVKHTLYFGTDNPPIKEVLKNTDKSSWTPTEILKKDTTYFWQVKVTDDENNSTSGEVWSFNTNEETNEITEHDFLIIINGSLKNKLDSELQTYVNDLKNEGYTPYIRYWTPGGFTVLKSLIKQSYDEYQIIGALLIGDMPSANFEQNADYGDPSQTVYEEFPSEFYFMDMDGTWEDVDNNGIFDKYPENLTLEIFTSRIIGTSSEIVSYLKRTSQYRKNGSFFKVRNFFSFIDDDWNSYEDEDGNIHDDAFGTKNREWELGSIYGNNYDRRESRDDTTKTTYLDYMTQNGADFIYQWIHSDPQYIYFNDNFSPNPSNLLSIYEIRTNNLKGSFYNLFDCSISRYTEKNGNIASEYIKGEYGLATVGSTKTGGIFNPEVMHIALAAGENWGTSYQMWVNDIWTNYAKYGFTKKYIESWWLGMMIQGDPLLRLTDKKTFITKNMFPKKVYSKEFIRMINKTIKPKVNSIK